MVVDGCRWLSFSLFLYDTFNEESISIFSLLTKYILHTTEYKIEMN